jgi:cardiolipin synthase A/B
LSIAVIILFALFLIFLWLRLDYKYGRIHHIKTLKKQNYPLRQSDITLFTYGEQLYEDFFDEIKGASHHIHILFYIVKNDHISNEFLSILKEKAKEGIEVRLLLDWLGSRTVSKKQIQSLKDSGILFSFCHQPRWPFLFYTLNARNHRKIAVIDGKIGYVGGFNIGKEYLGQNPKLGFWRDYHLKVTGEGVLDLQSQFLYDWRDATGEDLLKESKYFPPLTKGSVTHQFVPTEGVWLKELFIRCIQEAKKEIIICTPYFIPGRELTEHLKSALERGVRVTLLVPMKADHLFVRDAAFPYFETLLKAGCDIFRYYYGFYHAKVIIFDDHLCDIGTANFDQRSLYLNHEMNCFIFDKPFVKILKQEVRKDIATSEPLTLETMKKRSFIQRGKESFSQLLSHFL